MQENIKFIRRNGRIIPIRAKREKNNEMTGLQTFMAGNAMAVSGPALGKVLMAKRYKEMSTTDFLKKHGDMYERAGRPDILKTEGKGAWAIFNGGKLTGMAGNALGAKVKRKSVILGTMRGEEHFLHEMGHHEASRKKYSANKWYRKFGINAEKYFLKHRTFSKKQILVKGMLQPYVNLVAEAEATGFAIRQARRTGGIKHALKIGSKLALPYSTYGLMGLGLGISTYGMFKGIKNTFFRGKDGR